MDLFVESYGVGAIDCLLDLHMFLCSMSGLCLCVWMGASVYGGLSANKDFLKF